MNYIDINLNKLSEAKNFHYNGIIDKILNDIDKIEDIQTKKMFDILINPYIDLIISGKPDELLECHKQVEPFLEIQKFKNSICEVFKYSNWFDKKKKTKYDAYDLAFNIDIPTCVYCNRIYTKTVVKSSKITRPTFDHWFSKSDYPLLALSFYNLIPSCTVCNSGVKGSADFKLSTHFHPYHKLLNEDEKINFKFSYDHKDYSTFKFKIIHNNDFSENSTKAFKLKEIYETHEDEITDLRRLKDVYSDNYLQMLKDNILKNTAISEEEIYRLAFGTDIEEARFDRRPLSKMKKDILEELGIIKSKKL